MLLLPHQITSVLVCQENKIKIRKFSIWGENTSRGIFKEQSILCSCRMYVDDFLCMFRVALKRLLSLALNFRNETTLLQCEELSFAASAGFTGGFLKYII